MKFLFILVFVLFPTAALGATELPVPFTPQPPDANWAQPWHDACEESSIYMVHKYYLNSPIADIADAKKGILEIFSMKHQLHGESYDETVATISDIINAYLPWSARVVDNPTVTQIKAEIDAGRPVIAPFAAPELENQYFSGSFPYHVAVISGYDDEEHVFITQEPGTKFGKDFRYSYDNIMSSMHDFVAGNVPAGKKRVVFTSPELGDSAHRDEDKDGLTKAEEFAHGTITYYADSDGDGFVDGTEVAHGYSPVKNEQAIVASATLLISPTSPHVFKIEQGVKRHVASEDVFFREGWDWDMLEWVSDAMLDSIPEGNPLT